MENAEAFRSELETWLNDVVADENPAEEIIAFRFGLGEVEEGYVLYLAGSKNYNETDDEWAAFPPEFIAQKELIISANEGEEWYWVILEVIYSLGRTLRKSPIQDSFLGGNIPVYTGFESGDLYRLK
ncbi:hypothetical protein GCM10022409_18230 [Hymenobacter glaciei]|uniref:Uncharacterized protein n=1 Tax=Hymenobacter glaciei TaxID=877209 RepID=A0ABP7U0T1_9BACT